MRKLWGLVQRIRRPQLLVLMMAVVVSAASWALVGPGPQLLPARRLERPLVHHEVAGASTVQPVDCAKLACLALTFDDGPSSEVTPQILDTLDRHNAKATFFVMGQHVAGNEALVHREYLSGHEVGNHSWDHPHFPQISLEQAEQEVSRTQQAIAAAGVPTPHLFRPPYGEITPMIAAHIPLSIIRWNIDPEDWHPKHRDHLLEHMAANAKPGGMVVMHDTEPTTAAALDQLVTQLQASGYTLVTVSDLLGLPPGQPGMYFAR